MIALPFHPSNAYDHPTSCSAEPGGHPPRGGGGRRSKQLRRQGPPAPDRQDRRTASSGWTRASSPAAPAALYDNIAEAAAILERLRRAAAAHFDSGRVPPSVPVQPGADRRTATIAGLLEAGAVMQALLLRPLLRRRATCPPTTASPSATPPATSPTGRAPSPATARSSGSGPHGRPLHRRHRPERRRAHRRHGRGLRRARARGATSFDDSVYDKRVLLRLRQGDPAGRDAAHTAPTSRTGRRCPPWPTTCCCRLAAVIRDPVTTTDELIPSGETSSYRSNPMKLAQFTLSRRDPDYVRRAKADRRAGGPPRRRTRRGGRHPVRRPESAWPDGGGRAAPAHRLRACSPTSPATAPPGSRRPPASGCWAAAPISATNSPPSATAPTASTGASLPFTLAAGDPFDGAPGDFIYVPRVREKLAAGDEVFPAVLLHGGETRDMTLYLKNTDAQERELLLRGCLINYYAAKNEERHG